MQMSKENSTTIIEVIEYADSASGPTQKKWSEKRIFRFLQRKM